MHRSWKDPLKVTFKDAENREKGLVAQKGPDDSQVGEEVYQVRVSPRTRHCEMREDPVSGGDPDLVPGEEQPHEEGGLEIIHQAKQQRKSKLHKPSGNSQTAASAHYTDQTYYRIYGGGDSSGSASARDGGHRSGSERSVQTGL
jgi:hypothetical protein